MTTNYLNPSDESAKQLFSQPIQGEVIMLNLLRFKEVADYSNFPEIAPRERVSGKEAYQIYINQTLPFLEKSGGEIMLQGKSEHFLLAQWKKNGI